MRWPKFGTDWLRRAARSSGDSDAEEYPGCGSRLCQDGEAIGWAVDDSASDAENQMRMELWIAAIG